MVILLALVGVLLASVALCKLGEMLSRAQDPYEQEEIEGRVKDAALNADMQEAEIIR